MKSTASTSHHQQLQSPAWLTRPLITSKPGMSVSQPFSSAYHDPVGTVCAMDSLYTNTAPNVLLYVTFDAKTVTVYRMRILRSPPERFPLETGATKTSASATKRKGQIFQKPISKPSKCFGLIYGNSPCQAPKPQSRQRLTVEWL